MSPLPGVLSAKSPAGKVAWARREEKWRDGRSDKVERQSGTWPASCARGRCQLRVGGGAGTRPAGGEEAGRARYLCLQESRRAHKLASRRPRFANSPLAPSVPAWGTGVPAARRRSRGRSRCSAEQQHPRERRPRLRSRSPAPGGERAPRPALCAPPRLRSCPSPRRHPGVDSQPLRPEPFTCGRHPTRREGTEEKRRETRVPGRPGRLVASRRGEASDARQHRVPKFRGDTRKRNAIPLGEHSGPVEPD